MKTTHQIARELLALPDVPLGVEMWIPMDGYEMAVGMTECDPVGAAMIYQKPVAVQTSDA